MSCLFYFKEELLLIYMPEHFEEEKTSIWSFNKRGNWATHRGDYRGNCPPQVPRNLILKYTKENDIVLDPFCGSSTTGIASNLLGRRFLGIDQEEEYIEMGKNRREELENFQICQLYRSKIKDFRLWDSLYPSTMMEDNNIGYGELPF